MFGKKKSGYDAIESQDLDKQQRYRDFHEEQQVDRGEFDKVRPMWPFTVGALLAGIFAGLVMYALLSFGDFGISQLITYSQQSQYRMSRDRVNSGGIWDSSRPGQRDDSEDSEQVDQNQGLSAGHSDGSLLAQRHVFYESIIYFTERNASGGMSIFYQALDEDGNRIGPIGERVRYVPLPEWFAREHNLNTDGTYIDLEGNQGIANDSSDYLHANNDVGSDVGGDVGGENITNSSVGDTGVHEPRTLAQAFSLGWLNTVGAILTGLFVFLILHEKAKRHVDSLNLGADHKDINQHAEDARLMYPTEVMRKFNYFPNIGATSDVQVSALISHVMLDNKGVKRVEIAKRYDKDIIGDDGEIEFYGDEVCSETGLIITAGEIIEDDNGDIVTKTVPFIDTKLGAQLFEISGVPRDKQVFFSPSKIKIQ